MAIKSFTRSTIENNIFYRSMLAGNTAYDPGSEFILAEEILTSSQASVTFSGLSAYASDYEHLQLRIVARTNRGFTGDIIQMTLNNDTGANYSMHYMRGSGSSVTTTGGGGNNYIELYRISGGNPSAGVFGALVIDILDAFSSSKNTTIRNLSAAEGIDGVYLQSGAWMNTASLTEIDLEPLGDYVAGCSFTLIGVK